MDDIRRDNPDIATMRLWWIEQMRSSASPLREKMTLFWHGHFTSSTQSVQDMRVMARQNQLYRSHALGNFATLAQAMAVEPAMVKFLSGFRNRVGRPNENFARELLELFLLGVNNGYDEADVKAAARAWTGHNLNAARDTYVFDAARHDNDVKTFLGVTRNWDGPDIIGYLLTEEPWRTRVARFIARKVWSHLAYPGPDRDVVISVADAFLQANFSICALVRATLVHPEFNTDRARTTLLRTPTDVVLAALQATGLTLSELDPATDGSHVAVREMAKMGQSLFTPPDVSGWKRNQAWISTSATAARANFARTVALRAAEKGLLAAVLGRPAPEVATAVFDQFGIPSPSAASRTMLETAVTNPGLTLRDPAERSLQHRTLLFTLAMMTPEFQLA